MPTTNSAKKRHRQNIKRRARNRTEKAAVRGQIRAVRDAVAEGKSEEGAAALVLAAKKLDRAAAKKVLHKNTASRLKSRLSRAVKKAKTAAK